jgi:hypothetical protein
MATKAQMERDTIARRLTDQFNIASEDAAALRRIEMTLHRWSELECGDGNGCIERDEVTGKTYWHHAQSGKLWPTPDRERGALKRLAAIMARYPGIIAYHQGDPRGCALYILRASDMPAGSTVDSWYTRGVAVSA